MRQPTKAELRIEHSMRDPFLADNVTNAMLLLAGFMSGSLTLISEGIRSFLMLAASTYAYIVLRAKHRGRFDHYEYGLDKIESFVGLVVGGGLLASGLWVAQSVVSTIVGGEPTASPLGLAVGAVVNAVNGVVNILGWWGMKKAEPEEPSDVFRAQLNARFIMMASSVFLQITLTIAALAIDPVVALLMDALGAAFVATIMVLRGVSMLFRSAPQILDSRPDEDVCKAVREAAEAVVAPAQVARFRARPIMEGVQAEVFVTTPPDMPASALSRWRQDILDRLQDGAMRIELAVLSEHQADGQET
ncbi:cation transporter [Hoeflea sp. CAU 1731]